MILHVSITEFKSETGFEDLQEKISNATNKISESDIGKISERRTDINTIANLYDIQCKIVYDESKLDTATPQFDVKKTIESIDEIKGNISVKRD